MNYLDTIATAIHQRVEGPTRDTRELPLYRIYAVLALAKGLETTNEDVHNAWAAWMAEAHGEHTSIVPYRMLTPEVQALDTPYTLCIREIAAQLAQESIW